MWLKKPKNQILPDDPNLQDRTADLMNRKVTLSKFFHT